MLIVQTTTARTWDFKHLNPTWNFLVELGGKVRSLLAIMEHPINMAHLAKLFTAQLVQSCNFDVSILICSGMARHDGEFLASHMRFMIRLCSIDITDNLFLSVV